MSKVYVAGSINMDLVARADRLPCPGETVAGKDFATYPGGKGANQAVAAARLGAKTAMLGRVGADAFGDQLRDFLRGQGVNIEAVQRSARAPTGVALIVVANSGENSIVVVPGANALLGPDDVARAAIEKGDVVLGQFEVPPETIARLFARCRAIGATTILNAAPATPCSRELLGLADVLMVNETELAFFLAAPPIDSSSLDAVAAAARRLRVHPRQTVVATCGAEGALAIAGDREIRVAGRCVKVVDTTAAGDTFAGATAACLAAGCTVDKALAYANAAAALCVQRRGAGPSIPTAAEVEALFSVTTAPA